MKGMWAVKLKRVLRRWIPTALEIFFGPIWHWGSALSLAVAVLTSAFLIQTGGLPRVFEQLQSWILWTQAVAYVGLGWAILSLILAPFKIVGDDRRRGKWEGNHFFYNEEMFIGAARFEPGNGETHQRLVIFDDVEPESFVYYSLRLTPNPKLRMLAMLSGGSPAPERELVEPGTTVLGTEHMGTRISAKREATLCVRMLPSTVPVICRIYCHGFFVGKDGNSLR